MFLPLKRSCLQSFHLKMTKVDTRYSLLSFYPSLLLWITLRARIFKCFQIANREENTTEDYTASSTYGKVTPFQDLAGVIFYRQSDGYTRPWRSQSDWKSWNIFDIGWRRGIGVGRGGDGVGEGIGMRRGWARVEWRCGVGRGWVGEG